MFLVFFILWIIFNGKVTLEIVLFGVAIAVLMELFIWKFMGYKPKFSLRFVVKTALGFQYIGVLLVEIVKANVMAVRLIYSSKYEIEPELVYFKTDLKTDIAKVVLANSITITPGTMTVSLEGDEFCVHCLDKEMAEGIENSIFVKLLKRLEA